MRLMPFRTSLPNSLDRCLGRIARLEPNAKARWGRMNAHQMVCHLNDSFHVAIGEKYASPATSLLTRTLVKFVALYLPLPWPRGVPTRPEIEQGRGGTPPAEWVRDRTALCNLVKEFAARQSFGTHPMFGAMSRSDWQVWAYRHLDHHLRQFGM
jgi:hypothetical protein